MAFQVFCNLFAYCDGVNVAHTQNQADDDRFSKTISNFQNCEKAFVQEFLWMAIKFLLHTSTKSGVD